MYTFILMDPLARSIISFFIIQRLLAPQQLDTSMLCIPGAAVLKWSGSAALIDPLTASVHIQKFRWSSRFNSERRIARGEMYVKVGCMCTRGEEIREAKKKQGKPKNPDANSP